MHAVIEWLGGLPTGIVFLMLAVVAFVLAIALTRLSHRLIEDETRERTSASITTVVGVVAAIYAVLAAFVIVNEWQAFDNAQAHVSDESAALVSGYFSSGTLSEPARTEIQRALVDYDRSVICDEFPYLAHHASPDPATREALKQLYAVVAKNAPAGSNAFYGNVVDELAAVSAARRSRINAAATPLPDLLVVVILVTSLALVVAVSALDTRHRRWHLIITVGLSVLVALNLALVLTLSRPFDGAARVSDAPLREGIPSEQLHCP